MYAVFCNVSGFTFAGDEEPTALLQYDGGPCAVIVPVQAFLLKNLLFSAQAVPDRWRLTAGNLSAFGLIVIHGDGEYNIKAASSGRSVAQANQSGRRSAATRLCSTFIR